MRCKWQLTQPSNLYRIAPTFTIFLLACSTSAQVLRSFLINQEHTYAGTPSWPIYYTLHHCVSTYAGPSSCSTSTPDPGLIPSTLGGVLTLPLSQ